MKNIYTSLATVLLFGAGTLTGIEFLAAKAAAQTSSGPTTIVGTVSCLACRGTCPKKAETLWSCTLRNVRSGSPYVLVVGDQLYVLKGDTAGLEKFAGGKAAVHGQFEGSSIVVDSVSDAKSVSKTQAVSK